MYQYYIRELECPTNINYPQTIRNESILLSNDGLYKTYKSELYKYKLNCKSSEEVLIDNYILLVNNINWKRTKTNNIPFLHEQLRNITYHEYIIHPKVRFIIEKREKKMIDFYFQSNENTSIIQNEIASFLSHVK